MSIISHEKLKVSGIIEIETILSFQMKQEAGIHATAFLHGVLPDDETEKLGGQLERELVSIYDSETNLIVFEGIIYEVDLISENGYNTVMLKLIAGSWLLDIEKKSQSFQNINLTYEEIITSVLLEYPLADTLIAQEMSGKRISYPIIRYRETAWEFIGRLASHFNIPVFSDVRSGNPRITVGVPYLHINAQFADAKYDVRIGAAYWAAGGPNGVRSRGDFLCYEVEDDRNYWLGQDTVFRGNELIICGKSCVLERDALKFTYLLAKPEYCFVQKRFNPLFLGMSLLGRVLRCEGENLRVKLDIDQTQDEETAYPYPWMPETGNILYLMPEEGAHVSLHFGTDDEKSGRITVAVRDNAPPAPARDLPQPDSPMTETDTSIQNDSDELSEIADFQDDIRGLRVNDKQILLFPNAITLTSTLVTGVRLGMANRFEMFSSGEINIFAKKDIIIDGKNITVEGKENTTIASGVLSGAVENFDFLINSDIDLYTDESGGTKRIGVNDNPDGGVRYLARLRNINDPRPNYSEEPISGAITCEDVATIATTVITSAVLLYASKGAKVGVILKKVFAASAQYAIIVLISDLSRGRISSPETYIEAMIKGAFIKVISGVAGKLSKAWLSSFLSRGADQIGNLVENLAGQVLSDGSVDPIRIVSSQFFDFFDIGYIDTAIGIIDNVGDSLTPQISPEFVVFVPMDTLEYMY